MRARRLYTIIFSFFASFCPSRIIIFCAKRTKQWNNRHQWPFYRLNGRRRHFCQQATVTKLWQLMETHFFLARVCEFGVRHCMCYVYTNCPLSINMHTWYLRFWSLCAALPAPRLSIAINGFDEAMKNHPKQQNNVAIHFESHVYAARYIITVRIANADYVYGGLEAALQIRKIPCDSSDSRRVNEEKEEHVKRPIMWEIGGHFANHNSILCTIAMAIGRVAFWTFVPVCIYIEMSLHDGTIFDLMPVKCFHLLLWNLAASEFQCNDCDVASRYQIDSNLETEYRQMGAKRKTENRT